MNPGLSIDFRIFMETPKTKFSNDFLKYFIFRIRFPTQIFSSGNPVPDFLFRDSPDWRPEFELVNVHLFGSFQTNCLHFSHHKICISKFELSIPFDPKQIFWKLRYPVRITESENLTKSNPKFPKIFLHFQRRPSQCRLLEASRSCGSSSEKSND